MKVKVIASKPKYGDEHSIEQLVGKEFEVKEEDENGVYIPYGPTGLYFIYRHEFERIDPTESTQ